MAIEAHTSDRLPPLKISIPPAVPVETLVAVHEVHLRAADIPRGILRQFYEGVIGMAFVRSAEPDDTHIRFTFLLRRVVLERDRPDPGRLGILVRQFDQALLRLHGRNIPFELLHADGGFSRVAILRDPAGNWIHLVETRPF